MTMVSNGQAAPTLEATQLNGTSRPWIPDVQQAIERMRARVEAIHADGRSLRRTGQGLGAIHRQLSIVLDGAVRTQGWSPENRMAEAALASMARQLQEEPAEAGVAEIALWRERLQHAVFRAVDAATLLEA
jgi:hypothetical protein